MLTDTSEMIRKEKEAMCWVSGLCQREQSETRRRRLHMETVKDDIYDCGGSFIGVIYTNLSRLLA